MPMEPNWVLDGPNSYSYIASLAQALSLMLRWGGIYLCEQRVESVGWRAEKWLFGSHFFTKRTLITMEIHEFGI